MERSSARRKLKVRSFASRRSRVVLRRLFIWTCRAPDAPCKRRPLILVLGDFSPTAWNRVVLSLS